MSCETECFAKAMAAVFGADFDAAHAAALLASPDVRTAEFADGGVIFADDMPAALGVLGEARPEE